MLGAASGRFPFHSSNDQRAGGEDQQENFRYGNGEETEFSREQAPVSHREDSMRQDSEKNPAPFIG